jgi:5-(aminomethyl)-3-furanmethanol phosphate kinase
MFDALIKIGGSLYHDSRLPELVAAWAALAAEFRLLAVPGGGPFADQVRAADSRFGLSDDAAHAMAVLAMDQFGALLADLAPGAILARDLGTAAEASARGRLAVLAPSTWLLGADPLPHGWHVTSDSIAAWIAGAAGIDRLVLLKSVPDIETRDSRSGAMMVQPSVAINALAESGVVDSYLARALPPRVTCWIVDGRRPERLAELLRTGRTLGTQVTHGNS